MESVLRVAGERGEDAKWQDRYWGLGAPFRHAAEELGVCSHQPGPSPMTHARGVDLRVREGPPQLDHGQHLDVVETDDPSTLSQTRQKIGHKCLLEMPILRSVQEDQVRLSEHLRMSRTNSQLAQIADHLIEATVREVIERERDRLDAGMAQSSHGLADTGL